MWYQGGVTPELVVAGYDVVAIDPRAPEGPSYRRITLEALAPEPFDAVVAATSIAKAKGQLRITLPAGTSWDRVATPSRLP